MNRLRRGLAAVAVLALSVGLSQPSPAYAKTAAAATDGGDAVVASSDDVLALVAPIALYPDPILALILQSSTLPLQVVQAERFLEKRIKNKDLVPDPDWDECIIGLLNYPDQVRSMVEYIDWTEDLGNAVVDDLDEVQTSIQAIRSAAYYAGFLKSNAVQTVEVDDGVVRISPSDPKKVSMPQYDPAALLTSLDEIEDAEDAADEAIAAAAAAPALEAAPAPSVPAQGVAPSDALYGATATYPVTPPVITYGESQPGFWDRGASFAGGVVLGGLLGWGLTEAFDDDDHDWWDDNDDWDNDDVEDALRDRQEYRDERRDDILRAQDEARNDRIAARDERRDDLLAAKEDRRETRKESNADRKDSREDKAAQAREKLQQRSPPGDGKATAAKGKIQDQRAARDIKLPNAGKQTGVADKVRQRSGEPSLKAGGKPGAAKLSSPQQSRSAANAGFSQRRQGTAMAANRSGYQQVRKDANRGARSRQGGGPSITTPASYGAGNTGGGKAVKSRGGRGGGIISDSTRGGAAKADGARGRASRKKAQDGGKGGGGRRNR